MMNLGKKLKDIIDFETFISAQEIILHCAKVNNRADVTRSEVGQTMIRSWYDENKIGHSNSVNAYFAIIILKLSTELNLIL